MTRRAKNTASSRTTRVSRVTPQGVPLSRVLIPLHRKKPGLLQRLWRWFWGPGLHR
jgi:hypothetical protein